ncbi:MAG: hypothetical protein D4R64_08575 [Porphyromonadaceae bacterium]|nr:MAG: hypothetical protein D4R64_08575 [Porphyromonadaceae bacterium]
MKTINHHGTTCLLIRGSRVQILDGAPDNKTVSRSKMRLSFLVASKVSNKGCSKPKATYELFK